MGLAMGVTGFLSLVKSRCPVSIGDGFYLYHIETIYDWASTSGSVIAVIGREGDETQLWQREMDLEGREPPDTIVGFLDWITEGRRR